MVAISKVLKKFVDDEECPIFEMIQNGNSYAANIKKNREAQISIALPLKVCGDNLRDLEKWRVLMIAIPKNKVHNYVKAMEKYDPPVHKILDSKKLMMPDNLACKTLKNDITGNADWKYVTFKKCLKKKKEVIK